MSKKFLISLIGPPGSGKGSYGRPLAESLDLAFVGMSDVLRSTRPEVDLSSGKLVKDSVVEDSLSAFLSECANDPRQGFLLDGYPRTSRQLKGSLSIDAAILLAVPDFVCESKMLGRRLCSKCNGNFNISGVDQDRWCLPPSLPSKSECSEEVCQWETRLDDNPDVVRSRLQTYHNHTDPIVHYFEQNDRLLKLKPYNGFGDLPTMIETAHAFLMRL